MTTTPTKNTAAIATEAADDAAPTATIPPVFDGLEAAGMTLSELAQASNVPAETAEAWRKGRAPLPVSRQAFLALVLKTLVDELAETYAGWGEAPKAWHLHMQGRLDDAHASLKAAEDALDGADAAMVGQGEELFAHWVGTEDAVAMMVKAVKRVALGRDTTGLTL